MVAAATSEFPKWLRFFCAGVIPFIGIAEIMTISRAGVTILGLVLFLTTLFTVRFRITAKGIALSLVILLGTAGIVGKSWKTLSERFRESTFKDEYENKTNLGRGYYLRIAKAIAAEEIFGVGLNNWSYWVSNHWGPKLGYRFVPYRGTDHEPSDKVPPTSNVDMAQAAPAHSLGALTLGELGIPGFVLFALLWVRWFYMGSRFLRPKTGDPMRRIAVGIFFGFCGMFLQNLTEWVFRHLPLYYTFHVMLGTLMSLYYVRRQALKAERTSAQIEGGPEPSPLTARA
jgi:O-antigen ligase